MVIIKIMIISILSFKKKKKKSSRPVLHGEGAPANPGIPSGTKATVRPEETLASDTLPTSVGSQTRVGVSRRERVAVCVCVCAHGCVRLPFAGLIQVN